jgi:hypothetical protein
MAPLGSERGTAEVRKQRKGQVSESGRLHSAARSGNHTISCDKPLFRSFRSFAIPDSAPQRRLRSIIIQANMVYSQNRTSANLRTIAIRETRDQTARRCASERTYRQRVLLMTTTEPTVTLDQALALVERLSIRDQAQLVAALAPRIANSLEGATVATVRPSSARALLEALAQIGTWAGDDFGRRDDCHLYNSGR